MAKPHNEATDNTKPLSGNRYLELIPKLRRRVETLKRIQKEGGDTSKISREIIKIQNQIIEEEKKQNPDAPWAIKIDMGTSNGSIKTHNGSQQKQSTQQIETHAIKSNACNQKQRMQSTPRNKFTPPVDYINEPEDSWDSDDMLGYGIETAGGTDSDSCLDMDASESDSDSIWDSDFDPKAALLRFNQKCEIARNAYEKSRLKERQRKINESPHNETQEMTPIETNDSACNAQQNQSKKNDSEHNKPQDANANEEPEQVSTPIEEQERKTNDSSHNETQEMTPIESNDSAPNAQQKQSKKNDSDHNKPQDVNGNEEPEQVSTPIEEQERKTNDSSHNETQEMTPIETNDSARNAQQNQGKTNDSDHNRNPTTSNADAQQNNYNQRIETSKSHRDVLAIEFNPPPRYNPPRKSRPFEPCSTKSSLKKARIQPQTNETTNNHNQPINTINNMNSEEPEQESTPMEEPHQLSKPQTNETTNNHNQPINTINNMNSEEPEQESTPMEEPHQLSKPRKMSFKLFLVD
eukprot:975353_1